MSRVIHFEIHASDPAALIAFYEKNFGWKFTSWGGFPYWLIETGPADRPGINGGLIQRHGPPAAPGQALNSFTCTVEVDDVDGTTDRAVAAGAVLAVPKMAVTGIGWLTYIKDPDGNLLGLMQADPAAK